MGMPEITRFRKKPNISLCLSDSCGHSLLWVYLHLDRSRQSRDRTRQKGLHDQFEWVIWAKRVLAKTREGAPAPSIKNKNRATTPCTPSKHDGPIDLTHQERLLQLLIEAGESRFEHVKHRKEGLGYPPSRHSPDHSLKCICSRATTADFNNFPASRSAS